jgi:hypothetical protein
MWYTARHVRHPVHPQHQVIPDPTRAYEMNRVPLAVWIAGAIILGIIVLALVGYGAGMWETGVEP